MATLDIVIKQRSVVNLNDIGSASVILANLQRIVSISYIQFPAMRWRFIISKAKILPWDLYAFNIVTKKNN